MNTESFVNVRNYVTGSRFVGREKKCNEIMRNLLAGASSALIGLRRIGKTSVLKEIKRRLVGLGKIVLEVDMEARFKNAHGEDVALGLYDDITKSLDQALVERVAAKDDETNEHCAAFLSIKLSSSGNKRMDAWNFLNLFLQELHSQSGGNVYLLLDEFDACVNLGEDLGDFLGKLRCLIGNTAETGLVVLMASSRAIPMIEGNTNGVSSAFNGIVESVDLLPFEENTFNELCDLSACPVDTETRKVYFERSFGHPYLASLLLRDHNKLFDLGGHEHTVEEVVNCSRYDYETYFDELKNIFVSFQVDADMRRVGIENWFDCLVWRGLYQCNIPRHVLETFRKYGFWIHGAALPKVLREYLAYMRTDVWHELKILETRLRRLVGEGLGYYWGCPEWFNVMELPGPGTDEDPWKKDFERENKSFHDLVVEKFEQRKREMPDGNVSHLDCTYLDDLLKLIRLKPHWEECVDHNWIGFGNYFDQNRKKCKEEIMAAGRVRNPEAHFVDYPQSLKDRFKSSLDYLTGVLDRAEERGFKLHEDEEKQTDF